MTRGYRPPRPVMDRIQDKIVREDRGFDTLCWVWTGATQSKGPSSPEGYGMMVVGSRTDGTRRYRSTHRVAFEEVHGEVPEGMVLDHLCHQTICCNPDHLEPVTHAENLSQERVKPEVAQRRAADGRERLCKLGRAALDARAA